MISRAPPRRFTNNFKLADRDGVEVARRAARALTSRSHAGWGDFVLLAALLALTAFFGRPFSKLGVPAKSLYVTELVLAATVVVALWRCGVAGAVARVRNVVPMVPLLVLWVAGAIATVRGLDEYGFARVIRDIGLVEYSAFVPLVAVAVDTRPKIDALVRVLFYTGLGATLIFCLVFFFAPTSGLGLAVNPSVAVALYMALLILAVASRLSHGVGVPTRYVAAAAVGLVLTSAVVARSNVVALVASLLAIVLLAPGRRRLVAAGVAATFLAVSIGGALGLEEVGLGRVHVTPVAAPTPISARELQRDDALAAMAGGRTVVGDAARGRLAREVRSGEFLEFPAIGGLVPGRTYTIAFSVKPLARGVTFGRVGNTAGGGWGVDDWRVSGRAVWKDVTTTLRATVPVERLVLVVDGGASLVRFDDIRVVPGVVSVGARGWRDREPAAPPATRPREITPPVTPSLESSRQPADDDRLALVAAAEDTFDSESQTGFSSNARWRLAIWRFVLAETVDQPLFGVGFGKPTAFRWGGQIFDARRDVNDPNDVTAPHNSFVNLVYRTGLLGFVPFVILMAVAAIRVVSFVRRSPSLEPRADLIGLSAIFVFAGVIASLNVALEGPYMAMFFWSVLALLLVYPKLVARDESQTPSRR